MRRPEPMAALPSAAVFAVMVMLVSAPLWVLVVRSGVHRSMPVFALMWCPAAASVLAAWIGRRRVGDFGWGWPGGPLLAAGYGLPVLYTAVAYGAVWLLGLGRPDTAHYLAVAHRSFWPALPLIASMAVVGNCLAALGEEIGWRGFLAPVLSERFGLGVTALLSGAVWTVWHLPLILLGDYHGAAPWWFSVGCFTVLVMEVAFLFAWMRLVSGSVWPCVMLHAAHNTAVQLVFTPLTADTGHTGWFIDEFGAALPVAALLTVLVVLRLAPVRRGWGERFQMAP